MHKIEAFLTRKANKEAIEATPVVDGQLLWDKETGETYADVGNRRISTGKKQVYTATITSENGRLVCDMTASQIVDADRQGIVKAVYTDSASGETRVYLYAKKLKDGRAVFSKDGYIEEGAVKQALIIVDFAGNVTVETKDDLTPQFSSDTAAEVADKAVPGMSLSYVPGMEVYLQLDHGNTAEVMNIVPDEGETLPVYGNGTGKATGTIPAGYILHLVNSGDHWQVVNQPGEGGGVADHANLTGRDLPDQHPMSAITGLDKALGSKQPKGDYATNAALTAVKTTAEAAMPKAGGAFTGGVKLAAGSTAPTPPAEAKGEEIATAAYVQRGFDTITRVEEVKVYNILPPASESGYWQSNKGAPPTPKVGSTYARTPTPIDVSGIPVDGSGKRMLWVSAKSIAPNSLVSLVLLDKSGNGVGDANVFQKNIPRQLYITSECTQMMVWVSATDKGNSLADLCIATVPEYHEYAPGGERVYVKSSAIDPDYHCNPIAGKTIINMGDSIFGIRQAPDDISTAISKATGAVCVNAGFGGCKMAEQTSIDNWDAFSMVHLAKAIATGDWSEQDKAVASGSTWGMPDYFPAHLNALKATDWKQVHALTIAYGTNDFDSTVPLDTPDNAKNPKSFTGALRVAIEAIEGKYPNVNIFVCSQTYRAWVGSDGAFIDDSDTHDRRGLKLTDFIAKTEAVAAEYHLPYIDNYDIGINRYNRAKVFSKTDNTHFNAVGCKMIGDHMALELF